jgi:hypothetical protein
MGTPTLYTSPPPKSRHLKAAGGDACHDIAAARISAGYRQKVDGDAA